MAEVEPGKAPTYDPKNKARIHEVHKRGEWFTVTGESQGRKVSVDIHAKDIESRTRKDAEALMRRGLLGTANQERDKGKE